MLGTSRLTKELINKHDTCFNLQIGKPILPAEIATYEKPSDLAAYLRSRSYALEANIPPKPVEKKAVKQTEIDAPSELSLMLAELEAIREKSFLFSASDFECYLADYEDIPNLIQRRLSAPSVRVQARTSTKTSLTRISSI